MTTKEEIRPIYQEFQGYLSQAPLPKKANEMLTDEAESLWKNVNYAIDELNEVSGKDFSRFKISDDNGIVHLVLYRSKLGAIIDRLHGEYFSDEFKPFSAVPSTVVSQSQIQQQSMHVELLLEFQEKILEKIHDNETSLEEKKFFEKVKDGLKNVNNVMSLII
jgi:hypothetical protein